jgi:hypothetical protein
VKVTLSDAPPEVLDSGGAGQWVITQEPDVIPTDQQQQQ